MFGAQRLRTSLNAQTFLVVKNQFASAGVCAAEQTNSDGGNAVLSLAKQSKNAPLQATSSESLLPAASKSALPSSSNTADRRAMYVAAPVRGLLRSGALGFATPKLNTSLTTKPQARSYVTATEKSLPIEKAASSVPEFIAPALKAPVEGYNHAAEADEFLDKILKPQGKAAKYDQRVFSYFMLSSSRFFFSAGIRLLVLRYLYSWSASADVLAVSKIDLDTSSIPRGKTVTITWRGKPVFIRHRTEAEIEEANNVSLAELRDPQKDSDRTLDANWSVLLAICTHLGCVPVTDAGAYNAFFCPCHGSHYDVSGRIRKGPAPLNLEVPKHTWNGSLLTLG